MIHSEYHPGQEARVLDIHLVQKHVGDITEEDLRYVDCAVSHEMGIFVPSVGFCQYAIQPRHTHPSYSFVLFFSKIEGIHAHMEAIPKNHLYGTAIGPDVPHEENDQGSFVRYYAVFIASGLFERVYSLYRDGKPPTYEWAPFSIDSDIMIHLTEYFREYENNGIGRNEIMGSLSVLIAHAMVRGLLRIQNTAESLSVQFEIERVIQYLHQHFGEKIKITDLAVLSRMSESHFNRVFKKEAGIAPMECLMQIRIEKAKKLLKSPRVNITEVSLACGFGSTSHFSSSFQKSAGMTPTQYRKMFLHSANTGQDSATN